MPRRSIVPMSTSTQWVRAYLLPLLVVLLAMALQLSGWSGSWLDSIRLPLTKPTLPKPPFYFLATRLSLAVDNSVFAVRLPSVVLATMTVPLVYALGKSLFGKRVGLLASILLAVAPLLTRYAQEARMYAMLAFFSTLSLYLLWRAMRARRFRWWLAFALATTLSLYSHQFAFLSLGAMVLFALWVWIRARKKPELRAQFPFLGWHLLAALGLIALSQLPLLPFLIQGLVSEEGIGGTRAAILDQLSWKLAFVMAAFRLLSGGSDLGFAISLSLLVLGFASLLLQQGGLLRQLLIRPSQGQSAPTAGYAALLLVSYVVLILIVALYLPVQHRLRIRYVIHILPPYLLLVAYGLGVAIDWLAIGLGRLRSLPISPRAAASLLGGALGLLLVVLSIPSLVSYYAESKQNWRDATGWVQATVEPGEQVLVSRGFHRAGVLSYASLWDQGPNLLTEDKVAVLPKEPTEDLLPAEEERAWLIVPLREEYLPGGELDMQLRPYYRLSDPALFEPTNRVADTLLIGPIADRELMVLPISRIHEPSILLQADQQTIPSGSCTVLHWQVQHVREVYLEDEGVVGQGEREVCPMETATCELRVVLPDGTVTSRSTTIEVVSP